MVIWALVSFYFSFLFLFFIIKLNFTYLQVLSPNDTMTPMSVQNKRSNDMYRHLGLGEFLFFLSFLMFHHSTNATFLSTGLISQQHDNTNEHTKQAPKRHVSSFGPQVSFYCSLLFLFFRHSTNFYFFIYRSYLTTTRRHQQAYETGPR